MAAIVGMCVGAFIDRNRNRNDGPSLSAARSMGVGVVVDAVAIPTLIAVGILGAIGIIALSPAASYAMIGVGGILALPHIAIAAFGVKKEGYPLGFYAFILSADRSE